MAAPSNPSGGSGDPENRLLKLEERVRVLEDEREILSLLYSYGPLADSGSGAAATELWMQGGSYEFGAGSETFSFEAREPLGAIYSSEFHQRVMAAGCSHLTAPPVVRIDGDRAEAVGYSYVIVRDGERWLVERAAVNYWDLARTADGWRIAKRTNRALDGSEESRVLMTRMWR